MTIEEGRECKLYSVGTLLLALLQKHAHGTHARTPVWWVDKGGLVSHSRRGCVKRRRTIVIISCKDRGLLTCSRRWAWPFPWIPQTCLCRRRRAASGCGKTTLRNQSSAKAIRSLGCQGKGTWISHASIARLSRMFNRITGLIQSWSVFELTTLFMLLPACRETGPWTLCNGNPPPPNSHQIENASKEAADAH